MERPIDIALRLDAALEAVAASVDESGSRQDLVYFLQHRARFRRTTEALIRVAPRGAKIVDFGSHFLHQAALLAYLGYTVTGLDLGAFANIAFVRERARLFGIELVATSFDDVANGDFLGERSGECDAFLFCEVLEHITFNPIAFWHRARDVVRVDGFIYITTPNALKLLSVLGAVRGLVTLKRIGISTRAVFDNVTYGHHWKEYSASEIREYFGAMSTDFDVSIRPMPFAAVRLFTGGGRPSRSKELVRRLGNHTHSFAEQLEVIVRVTGHASWRMTPPSIV